MQSQPEYAKLTWKTFLSWELKLYLLSNSSSSPTLMSYLRPTSIRKSMQTIINLPLRELYTVIAWRLNRYQPSKRFCLCGARFQRTHIDCVLSENASYRLTLESTAYLKASIACPYRLTVFDHLLNVNDLDSFLTLIRTVDASLST